MKNTKPIAFFDSGVGGLTVYSKLKSILPREDYIYFGDTLHMPYGEKSVDELLNYADKIIKFFIKNNAKAVVMACNTTSSVIYDEIKDKYGIKIYPIVQSVSDVLAKMPIKRLGVFATKATINSNAYKKEIEKFNSDMDVIQIACPKWVNIVESGIINEPESILEIRSKLTEMMSYNPEKIVLGCTHYPFLKSVLAKFVSEDIFIDPSVYFAEFIRKDLEESGCLGNSIGTERFYVSSKPEEFKNSAKLFYDLKELPELEFNVE